MAKKPKLFTPTAAPLSARLERARSEGRFQQALELARQQYKQDPSVAHLAVLRDVSLERGRQLQALGHLKEAATMYGNALEMGGPPEVQSRLLEGMAACGDVANVFRVLGGVQNPAERARIVGHIADRAVQEPAVLRGYLPPDMVPQLDGVLKAFEHIEHGQDEDARAVLAQIGLQSPFLEWKVLARGLIAYYGRDDVRALENWQRLDAERLPARLAAPFRMRIDAAFRGAQPAATQTALANLYNRLQGDGAVSASLRAIQADLAAAEGLPRAFRKAEAVLPFLQQQEPEFARRLAECFRWAIIQDGYPEDLLRYTRVFGAPTDDPSHHRTRALALEQRGAWLEAQRAWIDFDNDVARLPHVWPAEQARHVRGLIWRHLGLLAAAHDGEQLEDRDGRPIKIKFDPPAEACLRKSLEFMPDALATLESLFRHLCDHMKAAKAYTAGRQLLERYPDHGPTLEKMAELAQRQGKIDEGQTFLERAIKERPLDADLRETLGDLHRRRAREAGRAGDFAEARRQLEAARTLSHDTAALRPLEAILEGKAGNEAQWQQILDEGDVALLYGLLCEAIGQGLPPKARKPIASAFTAALKQPATIGAVLKLTRQVQQHRQSPYAGLQTHGKNILAYAKKLAIADMTEEELETLCGNLRALSSWTFAERCFRVAQKRFPRNPAFLLEEGFCLLAKKKPFRTTYRLRYLLTTTRQLIEQMPRGPRQATLRQWHKEIDDAFQEMDVFRSAFFTKIFGDYEDEDEF